MVDVSSVPSPQASTVAPQALTGRSNEALLAEVATGDHAAFATLYDRVGGAVYGLVRGIVVDVPTADRVTEDVLLAVWTSAPSFDCSAGSARGWILAMAHRYAVDQLRGGNGAMGQVLRLLSTGQRSALELAYFHGLTYVQVARALDITGTAAITALRDGLQRLATQADPAPGRPGR